MLSSSGSASIVPKPRRTVRRGMDFLVMIMMARSSLSACVASGTLTHLKRNAPGDRDNRAWTNENRRLARRARSGEASADRSNRARGRSHTSAASRRPSPRTPRGESAGQPATRPPLESSCRRAVRPDASIAVPSSSTSRHLPMASKFSSAKPSGSIREWQVAHTAFCRCASMRARTDRGGSPSAFSGKPGTSGGGGRRRRAEDVLEQPFAAQYR